MCLCFIFFLHLLSSVCSRHYIKYKPFTNYKNIIGERSFLFLEAHFKTKWFFISALHIIIVLKNGYSKQFTKKQNNFLFLVSCWLMQVQHSLFHSANPIYTKFTEENRPLNGLDFFYGSLQANPSAFIQPATLTCWQVQVMGVQFLPKITSTFRVGELKSNRQPSVC